MTWNWAKDAGQIQSEPPTKKLQYPKDEEKHPFRTWAECERAIARSGLGGLEEAD